MYLKQKNYPKASRIKTLCFEEVLFKWKTCRIQDEVAIPKQDSGVFTMHYIRHFNGRAYDCPNLSQVYFSFLIFIFFPLLLNYSYGC